MGLVSGQPPLAEQQECCFGVSGCSLASRPSRNTLSLVRFQPFCIRAVRLLSSHKSPKCLGAITPAKEKNKANRGHVENRRMTCLATWVFSTEGLCMLCWSTQQPCDGGVFDAASVQHAEVMPKTMVSKLNAEMRGVGA